MDADALWVAPLTLAGVLGLCLGSFANVVAYRVPRGESVIRPRSRCPRCQVTIGARDNVPVLSWLVLGGRCRSCRTPIPWRYPAIELLSALVAVGLTAVTLRV